MNKIENGKRYGFMPGCSLSSYDPENVNLLIDYMMQRIPDISFILKCCGKPTRDIGEDELFHKRFATMKKDMEECSIDTMIFACPNCKKVFEQELGSEQLSLWEVLSEIGLPEEMRGKAKNSDIVFTIHDPCSARNDTAAQEGVRRILQELGYRFEESEYSKEKTRCCGFGGQLDAVNPALSQSVMEKRLQTIPDLPVVTYCATCRSAFSQAGRNTWHILELIFGSVVTKEDFPQEDILAIPENVWHNRYEVRKKISKLS